MATATLPDLFRTLGDPTRLRLLAALAEGELSVGDLADALGLAQSGVSRHLALLKAAGLVEDRREGTSAFFRVPAALRDGSASQRDDRASETWTLVRRWLDDLPEAKADRERLKRLAQARRSRDYFAEVAPRWDSLRAAQHGEELRHLALLELLPRELVVLDVGTGTGFMLLGVAPRVDRFIGVDASAEMLAQAREKLAAAGFPRADLRQGAMEALPVEDAAVDVVLANMVLHHAEDPRAALREMARVLRPGGRVVVTDLASHPHEWTKEELADAWTGFTPQQLKDGMKRAGLADASVRTIGTCTLTRSRTKERHEVDVLLATAGKAQSKAAPAARKGKR